ADGGNGFAERSHFQVNDVLQPKVFLDAATGFSQDAQRVRFVHHEPSAVLAAEFDGARQVDDVAVHAEDGIHDDEFGRTRVGLAQTAFEISHVVVAEADELGAGEQAAVY